VVTVGKAPRCGLSANRVSREAAVGWWPTLGRVLMFDRAHIDPSPPPTLPLADLSRARRVGVLMKCPRCQQESPADADFCPECGAKLAVVCVACGTAKVL
jgi:hypothetical protein